MFSQVEIFFVITRRLSGTAQPREHLKAAPLGVVLVPAFDALLLVNAENRLDERAALLKQKRTVEVPRHIPNGGRSAHP
jgi:hypothetical protein